jgi:hypothetical protein
VANSFTVSGGTTGFTAGDAGSITVNGFTTATVTATGTAATDRAALAQAINLISAASGVTAVDDGTGVDLVSLGRPATSCTRSRNPPARSRRPPRASRLRQPRAARSR